MLCTSGFMDDVTFGRSVAKYSAPSGVAIPGRSLMSLNTLLCYAVCYRVTL